MSAREYYSRLRATANFGNLNRLGLLLAVVVLAALVGLVLLWGATSEKWVVVGGVLAGLAAIAYFVVKPSFERAISLMILTMPILSGFVVDIGGNLRIPYIFTALALFVALDRRQLRRPVNDIALRFLLAFTLYAVISTAFVLRVPQFTFDQIIPFGFRITPYRTFVQLAQLFLMLTAFFLTISYLTSAERLRRVANLIFWATAIVTFYGTYEFIAAVLNVPYITLNSDPDTNPARLFAGTMARAIGGVMVPRTRSLLPEPLDLGLFLLFGIPFCIAAVADTKTKGAKLFKVMVTALMLLLFVAANSRSSQIAVPFVLLGAFLLIPRFSTRLRLVLVGVIAYIVLALMVLPLAGARPSLIGPADFIAGRVASSITSGVLAERPYGWNDAPFRIFRENFIFGVGVGNYPFYAPGPTGVIGASSPFSLHLRLLDEFGMVGATLFYLFVGTIIWRLYRAIRRPVDPALSKYAHAGLLSILGVMIAGSFLDFMFIYTWFWIMLAIGLIIPRLMNQVALETRLVASTQSESNSTRLPHNG